MSTDKPPAPQPERKSLAGFWATYGKKLLPIILPVVSAVLASALTYAGLPEKVVKVLVPVIVPAVVEVTDEIEGVNRDGWVNDAEEIQRAAETLPTLKFSLTPAGQTKELPKAVYLWHAHKKVTGKLPPLKDQNPTGSCVGFGTTTAIERTLACEIAQRGGDASEFTHFSEEVTYAGSRYEANGNRPPNFRGDGSNGSWAARFVTQWGMVPKGKYGNLDLTEYSAARARSWNYTGVPDELEPVARNFPVKDATRITNWGDAKKSLANGYGIQVASSQGFNRQRDANGIAQPGPRWAHSMCLDGYHTDTNGREYGHIENSWSKVNYHIGPVGWGEPTTAGFWADAGVIDRMLREGDSWAYSGAVGFPRKVVPVDWFVNAKPEPRDVLVMRAGKNTIPFTRAKFLYHEFVTASEAKAKFWSRDPFDVQRVEYDLAP